MTRRGPERRRDGLAEWTRVDQERHEIDMDKRLARIEAKVDRLTIAAGVAAGVAAAATVLVPLILQAT